MTLKNIEETTENAEEKNSVKIGDIYPINQLVGYRVVKSIDKNNKPIITETDKFSEAEILSFIYKENVKTK